MQIRFHCPNERCVAIIEYEPIESCEGTIECPRCHQTHTLTISQTLRREQVVDQCVVCGGGELFIRKDFPQLLGVLIVVVFGATALYYFSVSMITAWSILIAAALIDLLIYAVIGHVTTCYACRAQYRKYAPNQAHEGFDLATSEKY